MLKQYKQNQDLSQKGIYDQRANEHNPRALPFVDRKVYLPAQGTPLIAVWYLLKYVVDTFPQIREEYNQIFELLGLPGCQLHMNNYMDYLVGEGDMNITPEIIMQKADADPDFAKYKEGIANFILRRFNRKDEQDDRPRVTIESSPALFSAIQLRSFVNYYGEDPNDLEKYLNEQEGDAAMFNKDLEMNRRISKFYKKQIGFRMKHESEFLQLAEWWYQSNVIYLGVEDYCRRLYISTGESCYNPGNIRRDLKPLNFALRNRCLHF